MKPLSTITAAGGLLFAASAAPAMADVISDCNTAFTPPSPHLR